MLCVIQHCGISSWSTFHIYLNFLRTYTLIVLPYINSYTIDKKLQYRVRESCRFLWILSCCNFLQGTHFEEQTQSDSANPFILMCYLFIYSLVELSHSSRVHLVNFVVTYQKIAWRKLQYRAFNCWQTLVYCRLYETVWIQTVLSSL
jgi:hypothetical protein